jgi:hypothetical protein
MQRSGAPEMQRSGVPEHFSVAMTVIYELIRGSLNDSCGVMPCGYYAFLLS